MNQVLALCVVGNGSSFEHVGGYLGYGSCLKCFGSQPEPLNLAMFSDGCAIRLGVGCGSC